MVETQAIGAEFRLAIVFGGILPKLFIIIIPRQSRHLQATIGTMWTANPHRGKTNNIKELPARAAPFLIKIYYAPKSRQAFSVPSDPPAEE